MELGQSEVDVEDLVTADRLVAVHVWDVLRPFGAAIAPMVAVAPQLRAEARHHSRAVRPAAPALFAFWAPLGSCHKQTSPSEQIAGGLGSCATYDRHKEFGYFLCSSHSRAPVWSALVERLQ